MKGELDQRDKMERAAEERRREIDNRPSDDTSRPDSIGQFNPVEGVAPHRAGIPEKKE